ncbi:unnamed protein product [Schistosoma turkestanicum]|nr:unnamed protein product [Schistosoma turkestanicum]
MGCISSLCFHLNPVDSLFDIKTDPEIYMNISEIIRKQGYLVEEHEVTTGDHYILCLIRFYKNQSTYQKRKVVLLQHGLLDSSHAWVMNLRNQSLGYILADNGYDVWLGNSRGSTYSKKHKHLDSSQKEYWDFFMARNVKMNQLVIRIFSGITYCHDGVRRLSGIAIIY